MVRYFSFKLRVIAFLMVIVSFLQLLPAKSYAAERVSSPPNNSNPFMLPSDEIALTSVSYLSTNKKQIRIQFNTYVRFEGAPIIFIGATDLLENDNLSQSLVSCTAVNPLTLLDQSYAIAYDLLFAEEVPQNGRIIVANEKGKYNTIASCYADLADSDNGNIIENSISIEYKIPLRVEGYSVVAPNQVVLFFNYEANIAEQDYTHFAFLKNNDLDADVLQARSLQKIDSFHYILSFAENLAQEGRIVTDLIDSQGTIIPATEFEEDISCKANEESFFSMPITNPWICIDKAEYIDNNTARIYLSEKSVFLQEHPEDYFCAIGTDGSCIMAESVTPVDGDIKNGASVYDLAFANDVQQGVICLYDAKISSRQYDLDEVILSVTGKSLFAGYELSQEDGQDYTMAYVEYNPPKAVEQSSFVQLPDVRVLKVEILDPANRLIRLVFSEKVHINGNFLLTGDCGSLQWTAALDEQISPIYEKEKIIQGYSFARSIVVSLGEVDNGNAASDFSGELLSQTSDISLAVPQNAIVGSYNNQFFSANINANVDVKIRSDIYASLVNIQFINSKQIELTFSEPVAFCSSSPQDYIYISQPLSIENKRIEATDVEPVGEGRELVSDKFLITFETDIAQPEGLHLVEDRSMLTDDGDFFAVGGLLKAPNGKLVAATKTTLGMENDEICVYLSDLNAYVSGDSVVNWGSLNNSPTPYVSPSISPAVTPGSTATPSVTPSLTPSASPTPNTSQPPIITPDPSSSAEPTPILPDPSSPPESTPILPDPSSSPEPTPTLPESSESTSSPSPVQAPDVSGTNAEYEDLIQGSLPDETSDALLLQTISEQQGDSSSISNTTEVEGVDTVSASTEEPGDIIEQNESITEQTTNDNNNNEEIPPIEGLEVEPVDNNGNEEIPPIEGSDTEPIDNNNNGEIPPTEGSEVVPVEGGENSQSSSEAALLAATVISVPQKLSIVSTNNTVLSWEAVQNATSYDIEQNGTIIANTANTSFQTTGLAANQTRTYRVRAKGNGVDGAWTAAYVVTSVSNIAGGTLANNTTWSSASTTYNLNNPLYIPEGLSLSIMPGITVKVNFSTNVSSIDVGGVLNAVGTVAAPIVFTSKYNSSASYWSYIGIRATGEFNANYVKINYGGQLYFSSYNITGGYAAIDVNGGKLNITNSEITNLYSGSSGIVVNSCAKDIKIISSIVSAPNNGLRINNTGAGNVEIKNNQINISGGGGRGILIDAFTGGTLTMQGNTVGGSYCAVEITTNSFTPSLLTGFETNTFTTPVIFSTGTLNTNVALGKYVTQLKGIVTVAQGKTLTIMPGATIKGVRYNDELGRLVVDGTVNANGTAQEPILFTSETNSASSSWKGIDIKTTGELNASYVKIRYAGQIYYGPSAAFFDVDVIGVNGGKLSLLNSEVINSYYSSGIAVYTCAKDITIINSIVIGSLYGLRINNTGAGNVEIRNNQINISGGYGGVYLEAFTGGTLTMQGNTAGGSYGAVKITTNSFTPSLLTGFETNTFTSPVIFSTGTLNTNVALGKYVTQLIGIVTVAQGKTLTIMPGATIKGIRYNDELGRLVVDGTVNANGTAQEPILFTSETTNSYWKGMVINATGEFNANYVKIRYAGQIYYSPSSAYFGVSAIDVYSGKLSFANSEITNLYFSGSGINVSTCVKDINIISSSIVSDLSYCIRISNTGTGNVEIRNNQINVSGGSNGIFINAFAGGTLTIQGNTIGGSYSAVEITTNSFTPSLLMGFETNNFTSPVKFSTGTLNTNVALGKYVTQLMGIVTIAQGKTLTIMPGATIKGIRYNDELGRLVVDGTVNANGTVQEPILFTSETNSASSSWKGIDIKATGEFNASYVKIRYAGEMYSGTYNAYYSVDAISVYGGKLSLSNSEITTSHSSGIAVNTCAKDITIISSIVSGSSYGLRINNTGAGNIEIENNQINISGGYGGVFLEAFTGGTLTMQGNTVGGSWYSVVISTGTFTPELLVGFETNTFTSPVMFSTGTLNTNVTLGKYVTQLMGIVTVAQGKTLTIMPGATVKGVRYNDELGRLVVDGTVNANGTEMEPILFTSEANNSSSYWTGIDIKATGEFNASYVKIRYAGQLYYSPSAAYFGVYAVSVYGGKLRLSNSEITNSYSGGIYLDTTIQPTIKNNIIITFGSAYAVYNKQPENFIVDAKFNYWGTPYGPSTSTHSTGSSRISAGVSYSPYLGQEHIDELYYGIEGVYAPLGNYSTTISLLSVAAPGFNIDFTITYNSLDKRTDSTLGRGWRFGYEGSCKDFVYEYSDGYGGIGFVTLSNYKVVKLPDGSSQIFELKDGAFVAVNSHNTLASNGQNGYNLTTRDQYVYHFNSNGYLAAISDKNANQVVLNVDGQGRVLGITDGAGRQYNISYTDNLITSITDPLGRVVQYQYENGLLVRVVDPSNVITASYAYDSNAYLIGVKDALNHTVQAIVYDHADGDNKNKVTQITDTYGNIVFYAYDNTNKKVTKTDTNGRVSTQWFNDDLQIIKTQDAEGRYTYTDYLNKICDINYYIDRNGNKTQFEYDTNGNVTKIINQDGSFRTYTYDAKNNRLSQIDEAGKKTFYIYDANSNLVKEARPLNGTDIYDGQVNGSLFAITERVYYTEAERVQLGYAARGLIKSVTNPEGGITSFTYDHDGNVRTVSDPETQKLTTYSYNGIGWLMSVTTPMGYVTANLYDENGRLVRVMQGESVTRYVYDALGRKIQEIGPNQYNPGDDGLNNPVSNYSYGNNNVGTRYVYSVTGTVLSKTDAEGYTTSYTYDLYGNVLTETKPNGGIYVYQYDVMNRIASTAFKADASASPVLLSTYTYNILSDGKMQISVTTYTNDVNTLTTTRTYDYAGRQVLQQNADGTVITWQYNSNGTLNDFTRENGAKEYYRYDGLNRVTEKWASITSSMYAYTAVTYDKAGRVLTQKTGVQDVALYSEPTTFITQTYSYYANGLVKTQEDGAGGRTCYYYDYDNIANKVEKLVNGNTYQVVQYTNNQFGKPSQMRVYVRKGDLAGNSFTDDTVIALATDYVYDKNGNLISKTTPDGNTTVYLYDNLDRLIGTSTGGINETGTSIQIVTGRTLTWDGKELTVTDPNGRTTQYIYDARCMRIKQIDANNGTTAYYYDRAGRLSAVVAPNHYDPLKSLEEMNRTTYTYDAMGRVVTVSQVYYDTETGQWHDYVEQAKKYDAVGNLIKFLDALGYEAGTGDVTADKINTGYGTLYTYDLAGRLLQVLDPVSQQRNLSFTVSYTYDALGRKLTETDANGVITGYVYDGVGRVLFVTVKKNSTSSAQTIQAFTYDKLGRMLTSADANGNVTLYEYNDFNQVRLVTHPGDATIPTRTVYSQYDSMGRPVHTWDTVGKETITSYDNQGRVLSQTERKADGTESITVTARYDAKGNKRFAIDGNGNMTEFTYDPLDRVLTRTLAGKMTYYTYDLNGNMLSVKDWLDNIYINVYDPLNRLITRKNPYGVTIERLEYNRNNLQTVSIDAMGNRKVFAYDRNHRLLSTTDAGNHIVGQSYDNVGNVDSETDGNGNTTLYRYDEYHRLISVTNAKNEVTSYTYDANGNLLTFTDGKGNARTYEYNAANLVIKEIANGGRTGTAGSYTYDPGRVVYYTYTAHGLVLTKVDRNGETTAYTYDIHGRVLEMAEGSITVSYTYDSNGNVLTMTDGTGTTTRTYDAFNRVVTKNVPDIGQSQYVYDIIMGMPDGCMAEATTDPKGNVITRIYDRAGRLYQVIADGRVTTYTYYDNGNLQKVQYDDGACEEYTYYPDNLLHTLNNKKANGTVIDTYTYTYDAAHNILGKVDAKGTTSYTYDELNRLLTVTEPGGKVTAYTFDASGNRLTETVTAGSDTIVTTYTYDGQNRLTGTLTTINGQRAQAVDYSYDNNGNQLATIRTEYVDDVAQPPVTAVTNTYDELNRLISTVTEDGATVINTYNGDGLRVGKAVNGELTKYLYEGSRVVLELDAQGNQTAWNIYGTNLISRLVGNQLLTYMYNGHADVTALLDTNGNLVATYYYDAFGNILEKTGTADNSILYGGYQYDEETGLYYLNARMYDPVTARFLQEDTYKGQYKDPLSLNLYTYCKNEPLRYYDPTGHAFVALMMTDSGSSLKKKPRTTEEKRQAAAEKRVQEQDKQLEQAQKKATVPNTLPEDFAVMDLSLSSKYVHFRDGDLSANINPEFLGRLINMAYNEGLVFEVGYAYRSNAQQDQLNSVPGGKSWHNYGLAVDCKGTKVLENGDEYPRGNLEPDGIFEKYGLTREAVDPDNDRWEWWHITPIDCYPMDLNGRRSTVSKYEMHDWAIQNASYEGQPWS